MNVFFLSMLPAICAKMHGDLHLIKMILETTQLLSTCYRFLYGERPNIRTKKLREKMELENPIKIEDDSWIVKCTKECGKSPYKMTHYNHGCSIWARERQANFIWLAKLGLELCKEKMIRLPNNKRHCCEGILTWYLSNPPPTQGK
jgi:hypothetical protein